MCLIVKLYIPSVSYRTMLGLLFELKIPLKRWYKTIPYFILVVLMPIIYHNHVFSELCGYLSSEQSP